MLVFCFAQKTEIRKQIYVLHFESALIAEFCPVITLYAEITREQKVGTSHFAPSCVNNDNMEIQSQIQI